VTAELPPEDQNPAATSDDGGGRWPMRYQAPGLALVAVLVLLWLLHLPQGMVMTNWAISAQILAAGHWQNIGLHMLAHAGPLHLAMNCMVLASFGAPVVLLLGPQGAWLRFYALFAACGLAGLAFFLAIHPHGTVPMLGASGAIYGLIGFLVRFPEGTATPAPLLSQGTRQALIQFAKQNLILIALLSLPALLAGGSGGVAWESHLGGFLFGMIFGPLFMAGREPAQRLG